VAPDPDELPKLLDHMGAFMCKPYDFSADVSKLTMPVMLVYGDRDMIRPEQIVKFYQLGDGLKDAGWQREHMSKNRLAILPVTHYEMAVTPQFVHAVLPFLSGKTGGQQSSRQRHSHLRLLRIGTQKHRS
jgi:pimeloyl-ACP methyl ester carboxylesterase